MKIGGLVAVLMVVVACGVPAPTAQQTPDLTAPAASSPSPSPSAAASRSPFVEPSPDTPAPSTPKPVAVSCSSTISPGAQLALVTLSGSTDVVVRDITDLSRPVSRCAFKHCDQFCASYGPDNMRFVNSTHVSYIVRSVEGDGAMYLVDLSSRKTLLLRKWGQDEMYFWVYSWSPDGNNLTYLTSTEWRVRSAEGDVALSSLGRGLGYDFRHNVDSYMVGFSADGLYVAVDQSNTAGAVFKVVRLTDKKVVYSRSDGTMATWAGYGANLYFRTDAGLETWDPVNAARLIIPGLGWTNPVPSADGARIAYLTADANGHHYAHQVRLSDQPMQPIVLSTLPRTGVAFLNPALVWYAEEAACNQTPCRCDDAICEPFLTGRSYVHDLLTGTINSSVVTDVQDSWPRLGST